MEQQLAQAEMYLPRSLQVWRALMNWFAFFYQTCLQIVSFTPSMAQVLSYVGVQHTLLSSSPSFKPLPVVELPLTEPPTAAPLHVCVNDVDHGGNFERLKKLTVVLDLDETLVCAYETSSLPAVVRTRAIEAGLKWFELECVSSDKECEGEPKISYVTVFERPGLHEFLKQIGDFSDIILFTAGLEDYARPLVDKIDVDNQFCRRLYRPSTVSTNYREHIKDLSCLSKDLSRTVIVDNNPFSFLLQPSNGIPCVPFSAGQPHDEQLLEVILPLLKHLSMQKDVRPVLNDKFHMPEWFQMHGIPSFGSTM